MQPFFSTATQSLWDTLRPGVDMSSRPFSSASATSPALGPTALAATDGSERPASHLADRLRRGDPAAVAELFDRYAAHVERVLLRTIGRDAESEDMVQDVFLAAHRSGAGYQGTDAQLRAWVSRIAVFTARAYLRKRQQRGRVRSADPQRLPEQISKEPSPDLHEALRRTYQVLDQMSPTLRIPLALREIERMELTEIAASCGCSLSTIKRRLQRARRIFDRLAKRDPLLCDWVQESRR